MPTRSGPRPRGSCSSPQRATPTPIITQGTTSAVRTVIGVAISQEASETSRYDASNATGPWLSSTIGSRPTIAAIDQIPSMLKEAMIAPTSTRSHGRRMTITSAKMTATRPYAPIMSPAKTIPCTRPKASIHQPRRRIRREAARRARRSTESRTFSHWTVFHPALSSGGIASIAKRRSRSIVREAMIAIPKPNRIENSGYARRSTNRVRTRYHH